MKQVTIIIPVNGMANITMSAETVDDVINAFIDNKDEFLNNPELTKMDLNMDISSMKVIEKTIKEGSNN